jgi:hypothetical protein
MFVKQKILRVVHLQIANLGKYVISLQIDVFQDLVIAQVMQNVDLGKNVMSKNTNAKQKLDFAKPLLIAK